MEEQHLIRTAVGMLDQRCGLLMEQLFYRSNPPSYAEIARMLNLPEGSIGPLRTRCLQKLRRLLYQSRFRSPGSVLELPHQFPSRHFRLIFVSDVFFLHYRPSV